MGAPEPRPQLGRAAAVWGLAVAFVFALALRALGFQWVFVGGDDVVLALADGQYHARRALFSWLEFPRLLLFDPYINYPDGAPVAWPPLFDFAIAAVSRALGVGTTGFERVLAWASPVAGALTVFPVYFAARQVTVRGVALAAAFLYAAIPAGVQLARIGNPDHHSAVALIGAWLLVCCTALVAPGERSRRRARMLALGVGLTLVRVALLFTWHGSLLYLALADGILLVACAWTGRRDLMAVEAASAAATLLCLWPFFAIAPTPLGGPYSSISLSRLHAIAVLAVGFVAASLLVLETWRPGQRVATRLAWMAGSAAAVLAALLLLPGPREGLVPAFQFLTLSDSAGSRTSEQFPLFSLPGRPVRHAATHTWGWLVYAIPAAPIMVLAIVREASARPAAFVLAAWSAYFGLLAILQRRYGNDLAPVAALAFALALAWLGQALARRLGFGRRVAAAIATLLALVLLAPALRSYYAPRVAGTLAYLRGRLPAHDRALGTAAGSLHRFLQEVRRATPETSGFLDPAASPEYGVVAQANLGHALQYTARRATPTDPFWAYIGEENWDRAFGLLEASSEAEALALAEQLRARYVVTITEAPPETLEGRLHQHDGRGSEDSPRLERFRLVTEGPRGGRPMSHIFGRGARGPVVPYKLFEVVEGALLEVAAAPGTPVRARILLETPGGRRFLYDAVSETDAAGSARLRVPYPTESESPVKALTAYRVRTGEAEREIEVRVSEEDVRLGRGVRVVAPD